MSGQRLSIKWVVCLTLLFNSSIWAMPPQQIFMEGQLDISGISAIDSDGNILPYIRDVYLSSSFFDGFLSNGSFIPNENTPLLDLANTDGAMFQAGNQIILNDNQAEHYGIAPFRIEYTSTLGDLLQWLEETLGIIKDSNLVDLNEDGMIDDVPVPGVTLIPDGHYSRRIQIVRNMFHNYYPYGIQYSTFKIVQGYAPEQVNDPYLLNFTMAEDIFAGFSSYPEYPEEIRTFLSVYDPAGNTLGIYFNLLLQRKLEGQGTLWRYLIYSDIRSRFKPVTGILHFDEYGYCIDENDIAFDVASPDLSRVRQAVIHCDSIRANAGSWGGHLSQSYPEDSYRMYFNKDTRLIQLSGNMNTNGESAVEWNDFTNEYCFSGNGQIYGILYSQPLDDAGGYISEWTRLIDLNNGNGLFAEAGNRIELHYAIKGNRQLSKKYFVVREASTLAEFMPWLADALGIQTGPELEDINQDGQPDPFGPGVYIDSDGRRLCIVSNMGILNQLTLGNKALEVSQGTSPYIPCGDILPFNFTPPDDFQLVPIECVQTQFTIFDSLNNPLPLTITMVLQSKSNSQIICRYYVDCDAVGNTSRIAGTGLMIFDGWNGNLVDIQNNQLTIDRHGTGAITPQAVTLDFLWFDIIYWEDSRLEMHNFDGQVRDFYGTTGIVSSSGWELMDRDILVLNGGNYTGFSISGKSIDIVSRGNPQNCTIRGAIRINPSEPYETKPVTIVIDGVTIAGGNTQQGGGLFCGNQSQVIVRNCVIKNNSSFYGGGVYCQNSQVTLDHTIIAHNQGRKAAAIYGQNSTIVLDNCTVADNHSQTNSGAIETRGCRLTVNNSILWNNDAASLLLQEGSFCHMDYSDLQGGPAAISSHAGEYVGGRGNIDCDPLFVDAASGNYQLSTQGWRRDGLWTWDTQTSRCIDAGDPFLCTGQEETWLKFDPFNEFGWNTRVDLGAYGGTLLASIAPPGWSLLTDFNNDGLTALEDFRLLSQSWNDNPDRPLLPWLDQLAAEWLLQTSWYQP